MWRGGGGKCKGLLYLLASVVSFGKLKNFLKLAFDLLSQLSPPLPPIFIFFFVFIHLCLWLLSCVFSVLSSPYRTSFSKVYLRVWDQLFRPQLSGCQPVRGSLLTLRFYQTKKLPFFNLGFSSFSVFLSSRQHFLLIFFFLYPPTFSSNKLNAKGIE